MATFRSTASDLLSTVSTTANVVTSSINMVSHYVEREQIHQRITGDLKLKERILSTRDAVESSLLETTQRMLTRAKKNPEAWEKVQQYLAKPISEL